MDLRGDTTDLASRVIAGEMIHANQAAEAAEANRLRSQNAYYEQLLGRLESSVKELSSIRVEEGGSAGADTEEVKSAIAEVKSSLENLIGQLKQLQTAQAANADTEDLVRLEKTITEIKNRQAEGVVTEDLVRLERTISEHLNGSTGGGVDPDDIEAFRQSLSEIKSKLAGVADAEDVNRIEQTLSSIRAGLVTAAPGEVQESPLTEMEAVLSRIDRSVSEVKSRLSEQPQEEPDTPNLAQSVAGIKDGFAEQMETLEDHLHKENVKVFRNVQAAIEDEATKNEERAALTDKHEAKLSSKITTVMIIAIISLVVSLGGLAFQILTWLHIL